MCVCVLGDVCAGDVAFVKGVRGGGLSPLCCDADVLGLVVVSVVFRRCRWPGCMICWLEGLVLVIVVINFAICGDGKFIFRQDRRHRFWLPRLCECLFGRHVIIMI